MIDPTRLQHLNTADKARLLELSLLLGACRTKEAFSKIMDGLKQIISFNIWSCILARLTADGLLGNEFERIMNYDQEFSHRYDKDQLSQVDPVSIKNFDPHNYGQLQRWSETKKEMAEISHKMDPDFNRRQQQLQELSAQWEDLQDGYTVGTRSENRINEGSMLSIAGSNVDFSPRTEAILEILLPLVHQALVRIRREKSSKLISETQKSVLDCIQRGLTRKEVADLLSMPERTVIYHLEKIFEKLGVKCQASAVSKALALGLIQNPF